MPDQKSPTPSAPTASLLSRVKNYFFPTAQAAPDETEEQKKKKNIITNRLSRYDQIIKDAEQGK